MNELLITEIYEIVIMQIIDGDDKLLDSKKKREELALSYHAVMHDVKAPFAILISFIRNTKQRIKDHAFRNFNCFILKIILLSIIFTSCEYLENDSKSKSYNSSRLIPETVLCLKLAEETKHIDTLFSTNKIKSLTNRNILIIKNKELNKEINLLKIKNNVLYIKEITNLNNYSFNTAVRFYFNKNGDLICVEREKYYYFDNSVKNPYKEVITMYFNKFEVAKVSCILVDNFNNVIGKTNDFAYKEIITAYMKEIDIPYHFNEYLLENKIKLDNK